MFIFQLVLLLLLLLLFCAVVDDVVALASDMEIEPSSLYHNIVCD